MNLVNALHLWEMVDVTGIEPATPCLQSEKTNSILLVRLALFCVLVPGFRPNLAALFCYWSQDGPKFDDCLPNSQF